nr:hypothetical protein [Lachnospiraceae bacterium]
YYDTLYAINNNLVSADRDFYQALVGASQHRELSGEAPVKPEGNSDTDFSAQMKEKLNDFEENKSQVIDKVKDAADIASKFDVLYNQLKSGSGYTFSQLVNLFISGYDEWAALYDVGNGRVDWTSFNDKFSTLRDYIDEMQEITEEFAVIEEEEISKSINNQVMAISIVFGLLVISLFTFEVFVIRYIRKNLQNTTNNIDKLAGGDLTVDFPEDETLSLDEIGRIMKSSKVLSHKLDEVMRASNNMAGKVKASGTELADSATQASSASDQVTNAISEIAKGAVAQAESIKSASANTENIGSNIETIVGNVKEMDTVATDMKNACDDAMESLGKLIKQSTEVTSSVKAIGDTINSTNDSAKKISEFTQAITDISTQTNLLSLNASIEAARAGDAGRGFAVVADEIRQLADQSKESADKIKDIVAELLADSASSVSVLEKLNESFSAQTGQLESTKTDMERMSENVVSVQDTSFSISKRVTSLEEAKKELTNIVNELSTISQENAAFTEETNASMEELNSTFTTITDSAVKLQGLANEMKDTISYFKV